MGQPSRTASGKSSTSDFHLAANKKCPSCDKELPLHAFYTAGRSKAGHTRLHSHCKRCKLQRESRRRCVKALRAEQEGSQTSASDYPSTLPQSRGHLNRVPEHHSGVKLCTSCQHTKSLGSFYTAGRHKGGAIRFHSHCKSCKLEHEAAQRMQPRRDSRDLRKGDEGLSADPALVQRAAAAPPSFPQHVNPASIPPQMMLQHLPPLLSPQQLQSMLLMRQHPAMFSNPMLQSQLAMLMWHQMQHPQAPLWPLPGAPSMLQPPPPHQPQSMAAQSASTHQPANPSPAYPPSLQTAPSGECNSSGGSNDSGCMQAQNDNTPIAQPSPSPGQNVARRAFDSSSRLAEDSDSAVTWADKSGQQVQVGFRDGSLGNLEAHGPHSGLHLSGQMSGRDLSSSHMADAAHWRLSESPAAERATAADSSHLPEPGTTAQKPNDPPVDPSPSGTFPSHHLSHTVHQAAAAARANEASDPAHKATFSLLADLRHAQQQQRQQHQPLLAPLPHPHLQPRQQGQEGFLSAEQHAQNIKRSSRQAAKAAEQAIQAARAILGPMPQLPQAPQLQSLPELPQLQQAPAAVPITEELVLQWGLRKPASRVRGHRHPALRAGALRPLKGAATAGISKQPGLRLQGAATSAPAPAPALVKAESGLTTAQDSMPSASVPTPLGQAMGRASSADPASAIVPRHSRKKGKVQRGAFE